MKKILITGGSGFIGRNLVEKLSNDYYIYAPSHKELDLLNEDEVKKYIKLNKFDVIIHTATYNATRNSKNDLSKVLKNNLRMFINVERCKDYYGKMIYFSSGAVYDMNNYVPFMNEDYFEQHIPSDDYGFSKYIMSKIATKSRNIIELIPFGVFGKYEDWEIRFISNAICKVIYDLPITIKQNVIFDYMYIDDLVKITEWFINNEGNYRKYNVTTGKFFDLYTIANMVLKVTNKKLPIIVKEKGYKKQYTGDNSRLMSEIKGLSFMPMEKSIDDLYRWYKLNKHLNNKQLLLFDK